MKSETHAINIAVQTGATATQQKAQLLYKEFLEVVAKMPSMEVEEFNQHLNHFLACKEVLEGTLLYDAVWDCCDEQFINDTIKEGN